MLKQRQSKGQVLTIRSALLKPVVSRIVIGVTGSYGSGKSTVASMFKSQGARVLDADKIAHECIIKGGIAYQRIVSFFGRGILDNKGKINRGKLGDIVFGSRLKLKKLNSIIHPQVIRKIESEIRANEKGVIVLDAPLLLEAGLGRVVDKVVVVKLKKEMQLKRLLKRSRLSRSKITQVIKSQIPLREKLRVADFIIDNNGRLNDTRKQVAEIRKALACLPGKVFPR